MKKYLIGNKGNFYKANLHTHTTVSDGKFTPEEIKELYLGNGYSVVAFTDHNVIVTHNDLSDDKFLAITAFEIDIIEPFDNFQFAKTYHLNFYSKDKNKTVSAVFHDKPLGNSGLYVTDEMRKNKYNAQYSTESMNEVIRLMNNDGFLVSYNHPAWSLQNYTDYIGLKGLWGVEVFNSAGGAFYRDSDVPFVDLLRAGNSVIPIAADDTHRKEHLFGGFSIVEAENLEYGAIFSAMEKGDVYSSTGPLIKELSVENGVVTVKCDPVKHISLVTERRLVRFLSGENLTFAQFDITEYFETNAEYKPEVTYVRVIIEDDKGRKAWTRAYREDELK